MIDIYSRVPINRIAAVVTSQAGCTSESDIGAAELKSLLLRLEKKQRRIKRVLGVRNKRHHKNIIARHIKRLDNGGHSPRIVKDYKRNGEAMRILHTRLAELKS